MKQLSFADAPRKPRTLLCVLPDAARVDERLAELARARGLVAGRVACSIAELERELVQSAQLAGKCPAVASPASMLLALREAARDHSEGPFFAVRNRPGYARALGGLWAVLSQGLLDPEDLARPELPERVAALGRTLSAARALLEHAGLVEPHRALRLALQDLSLPLPFEVELDGILDWTPLRQRLAVALAARTRVRIRLPWSPQRELTEALEPTLRFFEGQSAGPELELFDPATGPQAAFLRRLFAEQGPPQDGPVELISCASPAAQAREAARRCAALLAAGAAPDSIAVAARSLGGGVAEELSAALDRAGIRWRERRGRPALSTAPVRLALSLIDLVEQDFPREPLIDLLCSRLLEMREGGDQLPAQALAHRLRQAHARDEKAGGGHAARLAALAARLRAKGEEAADLDEVSARVSRAVAAVSALPERATLREHAGALFSLLARWGLAQRLDAAQPAHRCLEEACRDLVRAAAQLGQSGKTFGRAAFKELLAEALASVSLPAGGARGGAVELVELRELWGRSFEHLILTGLIEGVLPARPAADALLSDDEKRAVNRAAQRQVFRERPGLLEPLLFQLGLASARSSAALLWPRADAQGRELLRSSFADEAARALGRSEQQISLSAIAAPEECAGASDLLARAALDAFAEPAFRLTPAGSAEAARALAAAVAASPLGTRFRRIARAAQAERERVRAFVGEIPPGRFSGQLSGKALEAARARFAFGPQAPASARQLEDHALCGFRALGRRLLGIAADDEDDEELGRKERGALLHRVLERFHRRALDEGRRPDDRELLREVVEAETAAFAALEHVGHPALWQLRRAQILEELSEVIEADAEATPVELERRFGFPDSWPALRIGDVHVRGAIDRIDRLADGSLQIIDYKSGRLDHRLRRKLQGAPTPEFQLALYVAEVRQEHPSTRVEAVYLSLRDAQKTKPLPDVQAQLPAAVQERAEKMRAGLFVVKPLSCDFCELNPVCRLVALPVDPDENGGEPARA